MKVLCLVLIVLSASVAFADSYHYVCDATDPKYLPAGRYRLSIDGAVATLTHEQTQRWLSATYAPYFYTFVVPDSGGGNLVAKKNYGYMGSRTYGKAMVDWFVAHKIHEGLYQSDNLSCKRVK